MSLSFRTVLPSSPIAVLNSLPVCAGPFCPRPPTLWQRWWARNEGVWLEDRWYCSAACFQAGLYRLLERALLAPAHLVARPHRLPLGLILLSQGEITADQLHDALQQQREAGSGRIGEWLVKLGTASESAVTAALAAQQGCPVFSSCEPPLLPERMQWPGLLTERYRALPVFFNPRQATVYVGFEERVDRAFLLSLERILRCRTQPCILPAAGYRRQQEMHAFTACGETVAIEEPLDCEAMTRTLGNYAEQVRAQRASLVRCEDRIWTRLEPAQGAPVDFLMRPALAG